MFNQLEVYAKEGTIRISDKCGHSQSTYFIAGKTINHGWLDQLRTHEGGQPLAGPICGSDQQILLEKSKRNTLSWNFTHFKWIKVEGWQWEERDTTLNPWFGNPYKEYQRSPGHQVEIFSVTVLRQKEILCCLCLPSSFSSEFPQWCVHARLNLGSMLHLWVRLSLPRHCLEGLVSPEDHLLNWSRLTAIQGFTAFQMFMCDIHCSGILRINCHFLIISSIEIALGHRWGRACGGKLEHRIPKTYLGLSTWIPPLSDRNWTTHCPSHQCEFLIHIQEFTSASPFMSQLSGLRTDVLAIALMLQSGKGK